MSKLVSLTIISYNQAQFLPACLESAANQNYQNIEIIVRDDHSTDGSQSVILEFAKKYPGKIIPIFSQTNQGLAANRHQCQLATRGEYIAWLDADDIAHPNRISTQIDFLEKHKEYSLCYTNMNLIRSNQITHDLVYGSHRKAHSGDYKKLLEYENFIMSSSLMYRVSSINHRGYHFNETLTYSDWHFFIRVAQKGGIGYIDECLGSYRRHSEAATAKSKDVKSGVRIRREQALKSMLNEFSSDRKLIHYCLSRYYISQIAGAKKQGDLRTLIKSSIELFLRPQSSYLAALDRRRGEKLLLSFE